MKHIKEILKKMYPKLYKVIQKFAFKPKNTSKKWGWLSTIEIEDVMKQYELVFKDFKFISCVPSDFYSLYPQDFPKNVLDTIKKSAIVFNTDPSNKPGQHWVSLFFENVGDANNTLLVEYFDSTGDPPIANFKKFLNNDYFKSRNVIYKQNHFKHQKGDTECGVFSLFYIIQRLKGNIFEDFDKERISDTLVNKWREFIFRPYTSLF